MKTIDKTTASPLELMKNPCIRFMFAYQEHDLEKMLSFCDPNGEVWFKPLGENGRGKIYELGRDIWSSLMECFPDLTNTVDSAVQDGEDSIRAEVMISGTQAKDFAGITNQGLRFSSGHIFIFRLNEDRLIDRIHIEWDHANFQKQLGS